MANYTYPIAVLIPVLFVCTGVGGAQTMTEFGAAAAGGAVGAASGKAVSNGIDAVFGKLNDQTVKAASTDEKKAKPDVKPAEKPATASASSPVAAGPVSTGASGVANPFTASSHGSSGGSTAKHVAAAHVKNDSDDSVPPPPPIAGHARTLEAPQVIAQQTTFAPLTLADALPLTPIAAPPAMTREKLQQVTMGMPRADVLKFGEPSSRIAMFEDGHMIETFSYRADGERFGRLQLQDGAVAKIDTN